MFVLPTFYVERLLEYVSLSFCIVFWCSLCLLPFSVLKSQVGFRFFVVPLRIVLHFNYIPRAIHLQSRIWMHLKYFENKRKALQMQSKWVFMNVFQIPSRMDGIWNIARKTKIATFDNSNVFHYWACPGLSENRTPKSKQTTSKFFRVEEGRLAS